MTRNLMMALALTLAVAGASHAENASLGKIKGGKSAQNVTQKVTIGKDQIAFAGGVNSAAHNWNAVVATQDARQISQTVDIKGNQIAAAVGKDSRATNLNAVIVGDAEF